VKVTEDRQSVGRSRSLFGPERCRDRAATNRKLLKSNGVGRHSWSSETGTVSGIVPLMYPDPDAFVFFSTANSFVICGLGKTTEMSLLAKSLAFRVATVHQLLPESFHQDPGECCGRWSADGTYYFFAASRKGRSDVWALREKTSFLHGSSADPQPVTAGPLSYSSPLPALSGNHLFVIGEQQRAQLQRFDSKSKQFIPFFGGISGGEIEFSRDGKWAAYVSYPDFLLWRSRSDGSERLQLTSAPTIAALPRWSPDGKQIVYLCALPSKPSQICMVSREGGAVEVVQLPDPRVPDDPQWSPDGKSLLIALYPPQGVLGKSQDFSVVQYDLQTRRFSTVPGSEGMLGPRWSPDGRYISLFSADTKQEVLIEVGTGKKSELATGNVLAFPNWSPDGKYAYFEDMGSDGPEIDRVSIATRRKERVVLLKSISRVNMADAPSPWNGLAPDSSPLIMRDVGSRELYSLELQLP
jgi:Tol biopolymer transport system component